MNYFDLALRWVHIFSAIGLVGGIFFLQFVWWPAHRQEDDDAREASFAALRPAWSLCVSTTSALLLLSGLINAVTIILRYEFEGVVYERLLVTLKLLLALALFYMAARLAGRSASAVQARKHMGWWLRSNTVFAVLVVALAGYMKVVPRSEKSTDVPLVTPRAVAWETGPAWRPAMPPNFAED